MELSSFSENIVTETFERNGESVDLKINLDAVVPEYYDVLKERLAPVHKRLAELMARYNELRETLWQAEADEEADEEAKKNGKRPKRRKPIDIEGIMEESRAMNKEIAIINRELRAEELTCPVALPDGSTTCVLKGWTLTENGTPLPADKATLLRLPPKAVIALAEFIGTKLTTVKKKSLTDEESWSEETPSTTHGGSMALRAV